MRLGIKNKFFCSRLSQEFRLFPASLSIADAKVMLFSELANFLAVFFQKKGHFIEKKLFLGL